MIKIIIQERVEALMKYYYQSQVLYSAILWTTAVWRPIRQLRLQFRPLQLQFESQLQLQLKHKLQLHPVQLQLKIQVMTVF